MNEVRERELETEIARLQELVAALEEVTDPATRSAARELLQVVVDLHGQGLSDLLSIVREAGSQPADTLLARFAANPRVRGLLLLHDLHPEDMETRARQAVKRLRPHLGVEGVRADLVGVSNAVVRISVTANGQKNHRPSAEALRREIEDTVVELVPDANEIVLEGLERAGGARESYVPLSSITIRRKAGATANATGD